MNPGDDVLKSIEKLIFRKITPLSIRFLRSPDLRRSSGLSAQVYRQLENEFQLVPPLTLHSSNPDLMAGVWSACRESLIAGREGRALREAVAAAVSRSNECPYCAEVHASMLSGAGHYFPVPSFSHQENAAATEYPMVAAVRWAAATGDAFAPVLADPPFSLQEAPQIMATAFFFHYINRMVNVFLDRVMMPVIGRFHLVNGPAAKLFSELIAKRITSLDVRPGCYLTDNPAGPLPAEFHWAEAHPYVAGGLLRFAEAAEAAAAESVDERVCLLLAEKVQLWNGTTAGQGKTWLEPAVSRLPESNKPQARLALLAAFASWQVDEHTIRDFRNHHDDDRSLLNTVAWGSYLAAKRIAGWLIPPRR
jgi:hypothetical protein